MIRVRVTRILGCWVNRVIRVFVIGNVRTLMTSKPNNSKK
jgi:hypothetical protein